MPTSAAIAFAGCDYLGLARDPRVARAAIAAIETEGLSLAASPATTGRRAVHAALERDVAELVGVEAAALLPSGGLANVAAMQALADDEPCAVWIDPRAHPSLRSAAQAAGFRAADAPEHARHVLVDGVYPARGEAPDLLALRSRLAPGGVLLVDDAHGFGVRGPGGRGSAAQAGLALDDAVALVLPFSKALGSGGAAVTGSAALVERVRASHAYVGSTALAPAFAAGARAALAILGAEPERRARLCDHVETLARALAGAGVAVPALGFPVFAVPPGPGRDPDALHAALLDAGFDVPVVRYPDGVAGSAGGGYLRLALSAAHSREDVERLAGTLARLLS